MTVNHAGFREYIREAVTLTTGEKLGLDVKLDVGSTGQTVTVSGEAAPIETRTSDLNTLIESKSIDALPLGNRRTLNVVALSGAAVFVNYPNTPANVNPNFSLAGGRTQSQNAWIDGGNGQNMRMGVGQINLDPPVEAVEEVKVLSNNYSAEYGGSAGTRDPSASSAILGASALKSVPRVSRLTYHIRILHPGAKSKTRRRRESRRTPRINVIIPNQICNNATYFMTAPERLM